MSPALFTQMSTGPRSRSMRPTTSPTCAESRISHAYPRARPPADSISLAAPAAPSPSRSTIATGQPSAASVVASALPRLRAPPVTSATRPRMPRSMRLSPPEARLALGEERLDALRGVFGLQRFQERAHLDVDRLVDRRLEALVDCLDDEPGRDWRAPGDLARQRLRVVEGLAFLCQPVDETKGQALRARHLRAEDEKLESLGAADEARQAL